MFYKDTSLVFKPILLPTMCKNSELPAYSQTKLRVFLDFSRIMHIIFKKLLLGIYLVKSAHIY